MKTKLCGMLTLLFALVVHFSYAQEMTITGTVTDPSGLPLPGVNVVVKNSNNGTQTDFDGKYSISSNQGDILSFSFVGFASQDLTVGSNANIDVQLSEDTAQLEEVIVTAQGIKREKKEIGYAVSTLDNEEIEQKPQNDIGRLLQGKAPGVQINAANGLSGSATNIVIRGFTSVTGSNQPLFIVDGVPFSSGDNEQTAFFDNLSASNRFLDIDPNNIADISILKGLSATALYGNRGRNGVILITTKTAANRGGTSSVNIATSVYFTNPHLPNYQDRFGGGFNQNFGWFFSNWGPEFTDTDPQVYGQYFSSVRDGKVFLTHPFATNRVPSFIEGFEDLAASEYEYRPYNSVEDFFRQGFITDNSVALNGGNENYKYSVRYGKLDDQGFTPGNSLVRDNFSVGGSATHGKLTAAATINYTKTDYKTPPIAASRGSGVLGDGASIFSDIFYTPRNVDLIGIPFQRADGGSLYYRETNGIQHPLWTVENSKTGQEVNSIFGSFNISYQLTDHFNLNYRYGLNTYTENSFYGQNRGGIDGDVTGLYRTTNIINTQKDHNFTIGYDKDLSQAFNVRAIAGFNSNRIEFDRDGVESTNQIVFGVLRHFNFSNQSTTNSFSGANFQFQRRRNTYGIYGDVTFSFKEFLFLNAQGRQDWTSVLESENNSIFYPSVSLSFLPTSAFEDIYSDGWGLNYLKLRAGYGSSAGFPAEYSTRNFLFVNGNEFIDQGGITYPSNTLSDRRGNPDLKPELVDEIEFGIDSRLLDNRLSINASYFFKKTTDLITDVDLDPSTGFEVSRVNAGSLEVTGLELDVQVKLIKDLNGFNWNAGFNLYADEPTITDTGGRQFIQIGGALTTSDARNGAVENQPYGVFLGTDIAKDANGNNLIDANGFYVETPDNNNIIGDPNPDFTSTFNTSVSYKGVTLRAEMSYRKGGDIYSTTVSTLQNRGLIEFPVSRFDTYVLPGVSQSTGEPNTIQVNATDIAFSNLLFGPASQRVYDGSFLRLNEVSLTYELPRSVIDILPITGLSVALTGNNLWYRALNMPEDANFDVNANSLGVGNSRGLDFFSGPSSARYGFSIKVKI